MNGGIEHRGKRNKKKQKHGNQMRGVIYRLNDSELWKPGEPLTDNDRKLLQVVVSVYEKQGFTPTKRECPNREVLKKRFRTWGDVLNAAGLPKLSDPEQQRKRQARAEWEKRMKELL